MNVSQCPREREAGRASLSGSWPEEGKEHVRSCSACREVGLVSRALSLLGGVHDEDAPLPTAAHAWWRIQVAQRREALSRATRPVWIAQRSAALCGSAAAVAAASMEWPRIAGALSGWSASWPAAWQAIGLTRSLAAGMLVAGASLVGAVLLAARRALPLGD